MKKLFLVMAMVLSMIVGTAFACPPVTTAEPNATATATATATGGAGGSATIQKGAVTNSNTNLNTNVNTNTFVPTNINSNIQGQAQGQKQGQKQNQNNNQSIAPVQTTTIETPRDLLPTPSQSVPFLYFGTGRIKDVTASMPNFAIFGIKKYSGEAIMDVINVNANVKFKNYFKAVLDDARSIANGKGFKSSDVRIMVFVAEAQKTWTTGGNLGAGASALSGAGAGASGAGAIIPQWGGTKADDLFTIVYIKVAQ